MMTRRESAIATMKALIANPPLLLFVEVLGLAGGLATIIGHNIWSGGALPVVITVIGWLMAIRGAGLLALSPSLRQPSSLKPYATSSSFISIWAEPLFWVFTWHLQVSAREGRERRIGEFDRVADEVDQDLD